MRHREVLWFSPAPLCVFMLLQASLHSTGVLYQVEWEKSFRILQKNSVSFLEEKHYALSGKYKWSLPTFHLPTHGNWLFITAFNSLQPDVHMLAFFPLCTTGLILMAKFQSMVANKISTQSYLSCWGTHITGSAGGKSGIHLSSETQHLFT